MSMFGELHFDKSRAVSDDEDDELETKEDESQKRKIYWIDENNWPAKVKVDELIVADGIVACAFTHTYLLNHLRAGDAKLVGLTGTLSEYKVFEMNRGASVPSLLGTTDKNSLSKMRTNFIYWVNDLNGVSYLVCLLCSQLKSEECYDWIDQLVNRVEFKRSLVVSTQSRAAYFGNENDKFPLVRYLSSEKNGSVKDHPACVRLTPPNFLQDLPAALTSVCVLKNLPFVSFVCYTAFIGVDLNSIKAIKQAIFAKLGEANVFIDNDMSKKNLVSLEKLQSPTDSLYM